MNILQSFPQMRCVRPGIATIPRLLAMASYSIGALGASLSAFWLYRVLEAMRSAESMETEPLG